MRWMMTAALATLCLVGAPAPLSAAEPIATTDGESPGLSLEVREFKVSNGTVMMKFTIANNGAGAFDVYTLRDQAVAKADGNAVSGIYLVDVPNKKKYFVVTDTDGHCVCSRDMNPLPSKQSANLWAKFPAPPDGVTKIGVVVPHFVPMDDVPLSR
jgi:hypothetical protein